MPPKPSQFFPFWKSLTSPLPPYISSHFSLIFLVPLVDLFFLPSICRVMVRVLSMFSSSWNNSFTLVFVLAEVSRKLHRHRFACRRAWDCYKIITKCVDILVR